MRVIKNTSWMMNVRKCQLSNVAMLVMLLWLAGIVYNAHAGYPADAPFGLSDELISRRMARFMASLAPSIAPSAPTTPSTKPSSRVYHVIDYGADPTASVDSTSAITKVISDAFASPLNRSLMAGISDLGGVEINLDGGTYLISSPIVLPGGAGNLKIHGGSLRATYNFPTDRYLIELSATQKSSTYGYEYITIRDLLLDCYYRGGGITIINALRTNIDTCYIIHFMSDGILVKSGHETLIRNCFIGQHITAGGDPDEKNYSGNGINLMGNDNVVTDVVILSAAIGILVSAPANVLTGIHCYNKASGWGGTGIYLKLPGLTQTRILNCYLDWTTIVAEDPVMLQISGTFFLGDDAYIVLKSVDGRISAVDITDNMFSGNSGNVNIIQLNGAFSNIDQVNVQRNTVHFMVLRSTVAKTAIAGNGTTWTVDFSPVLLFPDRIRNVQYTLLTDSAFPNHVLRNASDNKIVVVSDVAVNGTLHVAVDQNIVSLG